MAKVLAFQRSTSEVVTLDTVNNTVLPLGAAILEADTTATWPGRTQNILAIYKGDPYLLYKWISPLPGPPNEIRLAKWDGATWTDVVGFTAVIAAGVGDIMPTGLQVEQDYLVAVMWQTNTGGADGAVVRRSQDAVAWDPTVTLAAPAQPTASEGGHTIAWRNTIFIATAAGVIWYDPATDTLAAGYDGGDDTLLVGAEATAGMFAFWNNDLYFLLPGGAPSLYRLDPTWNLTTPAAVPAWTREAITGTVGVGSVGVSADSITWCLFVNRLDELCIFYSGVIGTKLLKAVATSFPAFTDITVEFLPESIRDAPNIGVSISVDDRRRTNELQSFLLWEPALGRTRLARWDGSSQLDVRTTYTSLQLLSPNERFGSLRTFTDLQPAVHLTGTNQPFAGRMEIDYVVRDASSRPVDIFGEYSVDGDEWLPMTQGDGDDGNEQLATTPAGLPYTFFWDSFIDLSGSFDSMNMRIVARLAGV
jgi:hypothetical protein